MCGILGQFVFNQNVSLASSEDFLGALNLQYHRGPDDWGIESGVNYHLGHRRLSIIDLDSSAKQPMSTDDQRFEIVFNGEIYNFQELRDFLIKKGFRFRTKSDTEVLLKGFSKEGPDFIKKCIGMFSFAVYDKDTQVLHLVRDRLGVKPLFYWHDGNQLIFSSEIKSIIRLLGRVPEISKKAISSYMSFRYPIHNDSFFEGIKSLKPAHYLRIENGTIEEREYWNPVPYFSKQVDDYGEQYYLDRLEELLISSVRYRMISDVPVGAYLSGGVDSSLIVALMAKESATSVKTFSIGFSEDGYNEFSYARQVAERYQTEHREIVLSGENYIDTMGNLIEFKDAPLSVPNEVPLYEMSRQLKNHISVVLSGEGADEIFGGYGRIFRSCYDYDRMRGLAQLDESCKEEFKKRFERKYGVSEFKSDLDHFLRIYSYTPVEKKYELLTQDAYSQSYEMEHRAFFNEFFQELEGQPYENKMMYAFERIHLLGLLHRVDMTTMATAVEARVPFVDHRLVEFAFSVPLKYKLKWNSQEDIIRNQALMSDKISEIYDTPKYLLKKYAESALPRDVIYRKKMGFPVPLNNWFGGEFNSFACDILLSDRARQRGICNVRNIERWIRSDQLAKDHAIAMKIWMLVNIELFAHKYFD